MTDAKLSSTLSQIDKVSNDLFPSILFNPIINTFDDGIGNIYWSMYDESNDVIDRAMNIGGKTKDYLKYIEEMEVYNDYMQPFVDMYGSIELVEKAAEDGLINEFIPRRPVLKKTKKNKFYIEAGIIPSRQFYKPSLVGYKEFIKDEINPEWKNQDDSLFYGKVSKEAKKAAKRVSRKMLIKDRLSEYSKSAANNDVFSQVNEIYASLGNNGYRRDNFDPSNISLSALKKERKRIECTPDHLLDMEYDSSNYGITRDSRGVLIDSRKKLKMDIIKNLINIGFDPYLFGQSGSITNKEFKLIISEMDNDKIPENVRNSKIWKKMEKQKKKQQKKLAKRLAQDPTTNRILSNSLFSYDDENNLASWTWDKD